MAGRPPKPIDVIVLEGKKHLTKTEIEARKKLEDKYRPNSDKVICPDWLDAEAKKHWELLSAELQELDLITNVDVGALAICCDAYSKLIKANAEIEKHGMLVTYTNKGGNKNIVPNPYVALSNKYSDVYKRFCTEFGLTPAARLKLAAPKEPVKPLTEFERKFGGI
ncbi:phage terminase small subunit P27 family [Desulfosporosinus sp. Sb-LF]|uniref:phage terminase small subunit P27 family n=1 Tax=Desulfosporosinus sp. Sb-LF TaxID=2560027 RepID=UPI00107F9E82|nr:phage terminase small subunit P27 family [Desulfosporosinus sp. Sb-LF]TGE31320.1 phage terminase small subunit P27 family [Desulfosporosinus sp. Sb-LF]